MTEFGDFYIPEFNERLIVATHFLERVDDLVAGHDNTMTLDFSSEDIDAHPDDSPRAAALKETISCHIRDVTGFYTDIYSTAPLVQSGTLSVLQLRNIMDESGLLLVATKFVTTDNHDVCETSVFTHIDGIVKSLSTYVIDNMHCAAYKNIRMLGEVVDQDSRKLDKLTDFTVTHVDDVVEQIVQLRDMSQWE